jgi:ATP-dependent RNA helicase DeaD
MIDEAARKINMTHMQYIRPALASTLAARKYVTLTPVQEAVLAPSLEQSDLLVSAQTGSGKTVAFGLAMAPTLLGEDDAFGWTDAPLAVAIAPTPELALQVKRELSWLYADSGAKMASCVGGMDMRDERRALANGAHIVVGTPGRLCDHIKRGSLDMSHVKVIVLDEADEMLKMGFREELEMILSAAPEDHRSLMFSATVPKTIIKLTKTYQKNAARVNVVADTKQHLDIQYRALMVAPSDQENAIINVLQYYDAKNAIVFCDTRVAVNRMVARFNNRGFSVVALSGELSQKDRSHALQAMRDGRARVCIATDVAARGLDLPDLELVIHASIPKNQEALLHRSGRTGRAGRKGVSALIVPHKARRRTDRLLHSAKITAEWGNPPSAADVVARDNERLLESSILTEAVSDDERDITAQLLEKYSAEHIAMAFIRQYRAGRSAPEELTNVSDYDPSKDRGADRGPRPSRRNDFDNGVWFSLNLGRKQRAEPRWILPMLCKSGQLKKAEIGGIKITETKTFIEISPDGLDRFMAAIGPDGKIEKAITATPIEGRPDFNSGGDRDTERGSYGDKNRSRKGKPRSERSGGPNKSRKTRDYKSKEGRDYGESAPRKTARKDFGKKDLGKKETSFDKPRKAPRAQDADGGANDGAQFKRKDRKPNSARGFTSGDGPKNSSGDQPMQRRKPHKKKLARAALKAKKGKKSKGRP